MTFQCVSIKVAKIEKTYPHDGCQQCRPTEIHIKTDSLRMWTQLYKAV